MLLVPLVPLEMLPQRTGTWVVNGYSEFGPKMKYTEKYNNIPARFWEWLAEILRHSAIMG